MTGVSIVTGAASGIGLALVRRLARRGERVVLCDVDEEGLGAAVEEVSRLGVGEATGQVLDVADADAVLDVVRRTHRDHGLDRLFNNAGIGPTGEPHEFGLEHWNRTIDVNLRGVVHGCHAAYPIMVEQGHGTIVNTGSLAGLLGGLSMAAPYAMTKHGVVGLSLALHAAGAKHGVLVSVVCPGGVDTPMIDRDEFEGLETVPSGRGLTARRMATQSGVPVRFLPPDRLAADVLRGVDRGKPMIVSPASARVAWRMFRLAPGLMLRASIAGDRRASRRS